MCVQCRGMQGDASVPTLLHTTPAPTRTTNVTWLGMGLYQKPTPVSALSPGTNLVLYTSPIYIALLISSYISKITRFVLYSPNSFSSLRFTIGNVSIM